MHRALKMGRAISFFAAEYVFEFGDFLPRKGMGVITLGSRYLPPVQLLLLGDLTQGIFGEIWELQWEI